MSFLEAMEASGLYIHSISLICWLLGSCILLVYVRLLRTKHYTNEPSYVRPKFPIIGHVIGLLQHRYYYFVNLLWVRQRVKADFSQLTIMVH